MTGNSATVRTTYFSALSHKKVSPSPRSVVFGIVRNPMDWVDDVVDRNIPAIAPPGDLLSAYKRVEEAAEKAGEPNPREIAWRSVDFEARYLDHLKKSSTRQVLGQILEEAQNRPLWLVCYEVDEQFCHRRLLAELLLRDLSEPCHPEDHVLRPVAGMAHSRECARCRFSTQSLTDFFDHDLAGGVVQ